MILIQEIGVAGNETTRSTLVGGLTLLLENPGVMARLRADLALIPGAVEEILRLFSPVTGMWRIAKCNTELGGVAIPAGAIVMARMEAGNHDPARFLDPERLDPQRKERTVHLAFGYGVHACVGNMLARRELVVAFTKLLARLENLRLVPEGSDLARAPSVMMRATKALRIAFNPGRARRSAA